MQRFRFPSLSEESEKDTEDGDEEEAFSLSRFSSNLCKQVCLLCLHAHIAEVASTYCTFFIGTDFVLYNRQWEISHTYQEEIKVLALLIAVLSWFSFIIMQCHWLQNGD